MPTSVVVFGTHCDFTLTNMLRLMEAGYEIRGFVVPGSNLTRTAVNDVSAQVQRQHNRGLPMATSASSSPRPCWLPSETRVLELNKPRSNDARRAIRAVGADIAIACCYPRRLPTSLVNQARIAAVNVHPSLLPSNRGPDPLFWTYRNGQTETGVSIHLIDDSLDTGPIVAQRSITISIGTPGDALWTQLSTEAGSTLIEAIERLAEGSARPQRQDESHASYFSWPEPRDLRIDPAEWSAWHAYHFCHGVVPMGYMPVLDISGTLRRVLGAGDYVEDSGRANDTAPGPDYVRFADGWVQMELGPAIY